MFGMRLPERRVGTGGELAKAAGRVHVVRYSRLWLSNQCSYHFHQKAKIPVFGGHGGVEQGTGTGSFMQ